MDVDVVKSWPVSKVRDWLTFFAVQYDLEEEAREKYRRENARSRR